VTVDARAALLGEIIDYAGLFPPASLDLPEALAAYGAHLECGDAALLGRFVLPAARLDELAPWLDGPWHAGRPLRLSLLVAPDGIATMAAFLRSTPAVRASGLEVRQPADVTSGPWLAQLVADLAGASLIEMDVYVELNDGTDADQLAALGELQGRHRLRRLGAKLRCGGVTADLVPPIARIAAAITGARDHHVPLKFTAGLHHPVRDMDRTEGVPMHGFLNVYGAALLAHTDGLPAEALEPVLDDEDPRSFRLDADGFGWRERSVDAVRIVALRRDFLGGYGSCSFDEPVADLRSLSLLT
jgi:hypothetical protein